MAIQFPVEDLYDGREYTPPGSSITYVYSNNQGWLLLPAEVPVSKDYVDTQDFLKYDKTGGKISGDVTVGEFGGGEHLDITSKGEIKFRNTGALKLTFQPSPRNPAILQVGDTKMMEVGSSADVFRIYKGISLQDPSQTLLTYSPPGAANSEITILKAPQSSGSISNNIILSNASTASFVIKGLTHNALSVEGSGRTTVFSNEQFSFSIERRPGAPNRDVFNVSCSDYKIKASPIYNEGLVEGGIQVLNPSGNDSYVRYDDDELIATLGVVKKFQYTPGQKVFADAESDAEIGGLWMDTTGFYVKYR